MVPKRRARKSLLDPKWLIVSTDEAEESAGTGLTPSSTSARSSIEENSDKVQPQGQIETSSQPPSASKRRPRSARTHSSRWIIDVPEAERGAASTSEASLHERRGAPKTSVDPDAPVPPATPRSLVPPAPTKLRQSEWPRHDRDAVSPTRVTRAPKKSVYSVDSAQPPPLPSDTLRSRHHQIPIVPSPAGSVGDAPAERPHISPAYSPMARDHQPPAAAGQATR